MGTDQSGAVGVARRLNRAAGVLALSTLLDSAVEHYRGSFRNRAMYTPLIVSALCFAVSAHGSADRRPAAHRLRNSTYLAAALAGIAGTGFHLYNVAKRPGGFSWQNLFYGSPLAAPGALGMSGLLGYCAERLRSGRPDKAARVSGVPIGRGLAALTSGGLLATSAEAGLLHFRGAYHNPFMYLPVTVPPVASALLAGAALAPRRRSYRVTRWWLRLTALLGFGGAGFHVYGVQRNMGGFRNWSQNVLTGPPIPAPPGFTALALAGLAALTLLETRHDV